MSKIDGGPAFPLQHSIADGSPYVQCMGMSLRDYFAAKAMAAFLMEPRDEDGDTRASRIMKRPRVSGETTQEWYAEAAYMMADAMLVERGGQP